MEFIFVALEGDPFRAISLSEVQLVTLALIFFRWSNHSTFWCCLDHNLSQWIQFIYRKINKKI